MEAADLEVTYRHGRPLAAYLCFAARGGEVAAKTKKVGEDLVMDFAADGRLIGVEIVNPAGFRLEVLNAALVALKQPPVSAEDLAPLALI